MLKGNSPGVLIPVAVLLICIIAFVLTLKSARLLKALFKTHKFQPLNIFEVQIRPRHTIKTICKRIIPAYGMFTYSSIQYEVPPVGHFFQLLVYFLTL
jgi:hypothetical protein